MIPFSKSKNIDVNDKKRDLNWRVQVRSSCPWAPSGGTWRKGQEVLGLIEVLSHWIPRGFKSGG